MPGLFCRPTYSIVYNLENLMKLSSEQVAYWYLRLNGFFTIPNFIIHPDRGRNQRTDVDILGVRFPFRQELSGMKDDNFLSRYDEKPLIILAEVKIGRCNLNGPWTDPEKQNMQRVLRAIGAIKHEGVDKIANDLYEQGRAEESIFSVSLLSIGNEINQEIAERFPKVPQITWGQIFDFIYNRLYQFRLQKVSHGQWDTVGKHLMRCMKESSSSGEFAQKIVFTS